MPRDVRKCRNIEIVVAVGQVCGQVVEGGEGGGDANVRIEGAQVVRNPLHKLLMPFRQHGE